MPAPNFEHDAMNYLQFMFHQADPNIEHICVTRQSKNDAWFNCAPGDDDFAKWTQIDNDEAWYVVVASIDGEINAKGTMVGRGQDHLVRYHILMLDDIGDSVGSKAVEPPVLPAAKIETSEGNYQWHYRIKAGTDFATYSVVVQMLTEKGYGDPGATGSYRVVRLPRSANLKPGRNGFRSRVEPVDLDTVWELLDLAEALGLDRVEIADRVAQTGTKSTSKKVSASNSNVTSKISLDPVFDWIGTAGLLRGKVDGDGWVIIQCPWHDQHTTGSDTASYSPLGMGGKYENSRVFNCFHAHCNDHDTEKFLNWVGTQGGPRAEKFDPLPVVKSNYVLIERGPQVLDLRERRAGREPLRDLTEFSTANYLKVSVPWREDRVLVKTAFLEDFDTTRCKALTYVPKAEDTPLITAPDGALLANLYMPPQWSETDAEPTVFLSHVDYLLPDAGEREYFIGWLAHKIQHPNERGVGIVMIAEDTYGVGRSWLGALLDKALPGEVRRTDIKQLAGGNGGGAATYNDIYANKQFVVVDETQADDVKVQYKAYENLKLVVDTSPCKARVNPKYGKTYDTEFLFNLLAFSNNLDALHIPPGDRRFCILSNPTKPRDEEYYTQLYATLDDPQFIAAVYWYLRRYDWSAINPRKPIKTKVREAMIEVTKSPREQIICAMNDDDTLPDFMTNEQLSSKVRLAASKFALSNHSSEAIISYIVKRLWVSMSDAPWKADVEDKRFRPRIRGVVTHIKAWSADADWPSKDADWEKIISPPLTDLSQLVDPKLGQSDN